MKKLCLVVLVVLLIATAAVFSACGSAPAAISGLWYEETGYGGTIEFKAGGAYTMDVWGMKFNGKYTFDESSNAGEIVVEFMGEKSTTAFTVAGGKLMMEGSAYTRDKVEQKSLDDAFEDWDLELEGALEGLTE